MAAGGVDGDGRDDLAVADPYYGDDSGSVGTDEFQDLFSADTPGIQRGGLGFEYFGGPFLTVVWPAQRRAQLPDERTDRSLIVAARDGLDW